MKKIFDFYLRYPIIIDGLIAVGIVSIPSFSFIILNVHFLSAEKNLDVIGNIISTNVSLAGFIIAALTVIVTFRSSIATKKLQDAANALELIFSSTLYPQIVRAYTTAILEFLLLTITLYVTWLLFENIPSCFLQSKIVLAAVACTGLTFFRSLWILILVLRAEQAKRQ